MSLLKSSKKTKAVADIDSLKNKPTTDMATILANVGAKVDAIMDAPTKPVKKPKATVTPAVSNALKDAEDIFTKAMVNAGVDAPIDNNKSTPVIDSISTPAIDSIKVFKDDDVPVDTEDDDLEIIAVSQNEIKTALRSLISKGNTTIASLYELHDQYNNEFFEGRLSIPLITIEKMSNKTLGSYSPSADTAGIENHMRFNVNFIALNTDTRIAETLRHEMIHQYQDEVLYAKQARGDRAGHEGMKRPKEWHNTEFRDNAELVGIPANGKHCTGNPALMPEAKSYNRKFACGCVASNGYKMTIWSTREVDATCNVCGEEYVELKKAGGTIVVSQSDIEKPGEDAIKIKMSVDYAQFTNFQEKADLTEVAKSLKKAKADYKEGIYQKGHNAYAKGIRYWIAWNMPEATKKDGGKKND
jgi:hypothetical protein